jgi:two-component system C4-dicarboxylate transport sensor histidine kinase DctB
MHEKCGPAALPEAGAEQAGVGRAALLPADDRLALERRLAQAERFAAIGRLSGSLAHELGSPLSVIGLRAAAIVQQTPVDDPSHQQALAITHEVGRATAFMRALLRVARRERVPFERVNVRALIERVLTDTAADAIGVDTVTTLPPEAVIVDGDQTLLAHALRNVVRNALESVRDRAPPRCLRIGVCAEPQSVCIEVEDNGPGIAAEQLTQLFEPFRTTKAVGEGVGLGLTISRGIIIEHGGEIGVANRLENGILVTIRLPRRADQGESV